MHGVHPAPNATPSGNAQPRPGCIRCRSGRRSANIAGVPSRRAYRSISTPNATMSSPEIRIPALERRMRVIAPVNAPSAVNTAAKPAMNSRIGTTGRRSSRSSPPATNDR